MSAEKHKPRRLILAGLLTIALSIFSWSILDNLVTRSKPGLEPYTGYQLASIQRFPDYGDMCVWEPNTSAYDRIAASQDENLFSALQHGSVQAAAQEAGKMTDITRPPVRTIRDTYPTYSYVVVDTQNDEVILQDNNLWSIRVFNRTDNTPPTAEKTEPKRIIQGPKTEIQFNNGMYVDPKNGDIYSVESDTGDKVVVFGRDQKGDIEPKRVLNTPHRGFGLAMNEETQELYVSIQYPPQVPVYKKTASGNDKPLRALAGESTRLSDTHGIALDMKNKLMFVNNWGHVSDYLTAGTGRMEDPSISIYPLGADGDTAPVRVIQGPKTRLNWPAAMSFDPDTGDLYVANDVDQSIVVFRSTDQGNVAPRRIIKGDKTGLSSPTGVFVDTKHKEVWVANFGNASATVYPLMANGNVAPLRIIRSAPAGYKGLQFGKVEAVAYDTKRQEYLVPN